MVAKANNGSDNRMSTSVPEDAPAKEMDPLPNSLSIIRPPCPSSFMPVPPCDSIEAHFNLPLKRAHARAADEAVTDASGILLNALFNIDTAHCSSRIVAETYLLSAANLHKRCIKSIVTLEKASLKERLKQI